MQFHEAEIILVISAKSLILQTFAPRQHVLILQGIAGMELAICLRIGAFAERIA
jgi:hypothetical protein